MPPVSGATQFHHPEAVRRQDQQQPLPACGMQLESPRLASPPVASPGKATTLTGPLEITHGHKPDVGSGCFIRSEYVHSAAIKGRRGMTDFRILRARHCLVLSSAKETQLREDKMAEMTGGCLCGQVGYTANADPVFVGVCHCTHCQKQTGTAFSVLVGIPKSATSIQGRLKTFHDTGDSGQPVDRNFCPECGSPIFSDVAVMPGLTFIKAGTLDDTSWSSLP